MELQVPLGTAKEMLVVNLWSNNCRWAIEADKNLAIPLQRSLPPVVIYSRSPDG